MCFCVPEPESAESCVALSDRHRGVAQLYNCWWKVSFSFVFAGTSEFASLSIEFKNLNMLFYHLLVMGFMLATCFAGGIDDPRVSTIAPNSKRTIDRARFAINTIFPDKSSRPKFHVTRATQEEVAGYKFFIEMQIILQGDKCYFKEVGVWEKNDNTGLYLIENTDRPELPCMLAPRNYGGDLFNWFGYFMSWFGYDMEAFF